MRTLVHDVRFALRLLRKTPLLTAVSVASLALGIGSATAVFSLADTLLLRPLPVVPAPERLFAMPGVEEENPDRFRRLSWANYRDYASQTESIARLAATADCDLSLTHRGPAERISGLAVSTNYFTVLGLKPALGRLFSPGGEDVPVAVLGHALWKRRFGADPGVIGSPIVLNGKSMTIVGIAPEGFSGTDLIVRREIWLPLGVYPEIVKGVLVSFAGKHDRKQEWLQVIGRLSAGSGLGQARNAFSVVAGRLAAAHPEINAGLGVRVLPLTELALGEDNRPLFVGFIVRLTVFMALVLSTAVINVAGLLLARALARRQEIAIRLSLGAGRARLMRQLLVEGLVLAAFGAAGGVALAAAGLPLVEHIRLPAGLSGYDLELSGRVLGLASLVSLAACLVFAFIPALQALRTRVAPALRGEVPRGSRFRFGMRELLASAQVSLALLLLLAAGLFLRTFVNLRAIDPGFDPSRVLVASVDLSPAGYEGPRVSGFYQELLERLRRLPEVEAASMASALPVMGGSLQVDLTVTLTGAPAPDGKPSPPVRHALIGDGYFRTVGMKLARGRDFGPEDDLSGPGVVIVNETAARLLWPGRDPLGQRLRLVQSEMPFEVVGLAADSTYSDLKEESVPLLYLAHSQADKSFIGSLLAPEMTLLVRTTEVSGQAVRALRETVRTVDPLLPVFRISTLDELLSATVGVERQAAVLSGGLALVAVAMAMMGLYGVLAHSIVERTREIGIRVACGAKPAHVRDLVLHRTIVLALAGVAVGLSAAFPARRIVASQLYGIEADDEITWIGTTLILVGTSILVSLIPAQRAARINPVAALRSD